MPWHAYIDNLVAFKKKGLVIDMERHTAENGNKKAAPHYAFMIDCIGATEGKFFKKPLSADAFKNTMKSLGNFKLEKETDIAIVYRNGDIIIDWENSVSYKSEKAGTMIGLIQTKPMPSLNEMLKNVLPAAIKDWNILAEKLNLPEIGSALLKKLSTQAMLANKNYPQIKNGTKWPNNPIRFWFEQE